MRQRREEALELFRFATTAADKVEPFALDYFHASRMLGRKGRPRR